jgi:hypothetical protein
MGSIVEHFGQNAGKVWKVLNTHGSLTHTKLMTATRLKEDEFYAAIGWLAKENKICKDGRVYRLGWTNLTDKIGEDAGKLWSILDTWGEMDATYLPKLAGVDPEDVYSALGWLAREGKLDVKKVKPKTPQIKYTLK